MMGALVKVGDLVKSLDDDWAGVAIVTQIDERTLPALVTVSLLGDGELFQTTADDTEVVNDN